MNWYLNYPESRMGMKLKLFENIWQTEYCLQKEFGIIKFILHSGININDSSKILKNKQSL